MSLLGNEIPTNWRGNEIPTTHLSELYTIYNPAIWSRPHKDTNFPHCIRPDARTCSQDLSTFSIDNISAKFFQLLHNQNFDAHFTLTVLYSRALIFTIDQQECSRQTTQELSLSFQIAL